MDLEVVGRRALLLEDDASAAFFDSTDALVEWHSVQIDRFDVRRLLSAPLPPPSRDRNSELIMLEYSFFESQFDHERYLDLRMLSDKLSVPYPDRLSVPYQADCNINLPQKFNGTSSSVAMPFRFEPATPDQQKQMKNLQFVQVPLFSANDILNQEENKNYNVFFNQQPEIIERKHTELDNTLGVPSAAFLTPQREKINPDYGNGGIDLNKTPQQKQPKRKKHRPKVVAEGKSKRTPKLDTPINITPDKMPTGKRKYERKKNTKTSSTPLADVVNEVEASTIEFAVKSCRRALNFDLENDVEKLSQGAVVGIRAQNKERSKVPLNLNLNSRSSEWSKELGGISTSGVKEGHIKENSYNFLNFVHHIPPQESIPNVPTPPTPPSKNHTLNFIARSLNVRNAKASQNDQNRYSHIHQLMSGDLVQLVMEANAHGENLEKMRQPNLQTSTQIVKDVVGITENQGCKRKYYDNQQRQPQTEALMGTQLWSIGDSKRDHDKSNSSKLWQNSSETIKRNKNVDMFQGSSSSMSSRITTVEDSSGEMKSRGCRSLHAQSSALYMHDGLPNSSNFRNANIEANKITCNWFMHSKNSKHKFQQQHTSSQIHLCAEQMAQKTSPHISQAQSLNSLSAVTNWNSKSTTQRDMMIHGNEIENAPSHESVKRQTVGRTSDEFSCIKEVFQEEIKHSEGSGHSFETVTVSQEHRRKLFSVDYITESMKNLHIYDNGKEVVRKVQKVQNALIPYRGDGAIVSYEAFDPIKKRRPRPKVDLDLETNRVWNLLMGKGGQSEEPIDNDKENWWEKERAVLRNRADSFIARMHLVQGNRRFSKWKGSVVDSVIGVFLTQNVSDYLSSSAFMSLAAKFPLKSITRGEACCQNGRIPLVQPDRVRITYPDGTAYDHRMMREPMCNHSSVTSSESTECGAEIVKTAERNYVIIDHTRKNGEDVISSQSSSESVIFQASEDIRSSSGSNSEAEDQITGWNFSKDHGLFSFSEPAERIAAFKQCHFEVMGSSFPDKSLTHSHCQLEIPIQEQTSGLTSDRYAHAYPFAPTMLPHRRPVPLPNVSMGLEKWETDFLAFSGQGTISSLVSTDANLTYGMGVGQEHNFPKRIVGSDFTAQQTRIPEAQISTANHGISNEDFEQQTNLSAVSQSRKDQHLINCRYDRRQVSFQQEIRFTKDPISQAETISQSPKNSRHSNEMTLELAEMRQVHSLSAPSSKMNTTMSHTSKIKAEKEKTDSFDWDILRKNVQSETGTRIRNRDTMDSMDYEALRNADVREISEAIKARGMNNMLAERIKEFLNRLVEDHEKIDLEWLRDVHPDKAKDYLLSIRGLGLKSVECVRLLTLHNVAFPVDTNVGRIAVRLGWVPLRPLPESVQLHLLELYPVLESIQKYLWPRLCHLDQESLYELHYQLITFGKVFCTKRDPNCNACPMRGECRHFASAYASARLALPGPEQQQIVCSATPESAKKSPEIIMKPLPLPAAKDNLVRGTGLTINSEPIIEEPTTPEASIEVLEKDIEDAYYDDPDEIPVINLNIEEFTTNLQSFMQENKEMQGDMSQALVVLSPELASIPMPKLKHAGRLRTEHQVYELPDSHPLLEGLDKREPDDPSPYLLVLWAPGDTANSVQPPGSKCSSQEGGSWCNKQTCFSCSTTREANAQTVRCTILLVDALQDSNERKFPAQWHIFPGQ